MLALTKYLKEEYRLYLYFLCFFIVGTILISLAVSYYVYDLSGLYKLNWLEGIKVSRSKIVNIHAGFDETSDLLRDKFKPENLIVFDFYDPIKHTEISIKRARKAYPPFPSTERVTTTKLPLADKSVDTIFVLFSAHEVRNESERIDFFKELKRVVRPTGKIIITEHLRDVANFLAYSIGFLHFYSRSSWYRVLDTAQLKIQEEKKCTPFISTFILKSDGDTF
jgi:SAM-dependent methyltransferase